MWILRTPKRFKEVCEYHDAKWTPDYCRNVCPGKLVRGECVINAEGLFVPGTKKSIQKLFRWEAR